MSDDAAIRELIQIYFDGMFESSAEKTHAAFHADAKIVGELGGKLREMTVGQFADLVAANVPSAKTNGDTPRLEVVSLDIAGNTAVARVRDDYAGNTFLDTLSILKTDNEWRIYNKLFHVEGPAQ